MADMQLTDLLEESLGHYQPKGVAFRFFEFESSTKWPMDSVHAFLQSLLMRHADLLAYDFYGVDVLVSEPQYVFANRHKIVVRPAPSGIASGLRVFYRTESAQSLCVVFSQIEEALAACRL
jgi:hypothetical protein